MVPRTIHSTVRSGAERLVFSLIERAPNSDDWICLHSLGLADHPRKRRAEIDFLLITPEALVVLEVKGGRVTRQDGLWHFTDKRDRTYTKPEGPFDQAASAMFALEKTLKAQFAQDRRELPLMAYGVVTPDIQFDHLGVEGDRDLVFDKRDRFSPFSEFADRVIRVARSRAHTTAAAMSASERRTLLTFLRGDFDLVPSVATVAEDSQRQLNALTQEQYATLDALQGFPRVIVEGVAGSGKTVLALELARRAARHGEDVLLLCYNRLLAEALRHAAGIEDYAGRLDVCTLHSYCHDLIMGSSLADDFRATRAVAGRDELFESVYPEFAALALLEKSTTGPDRIVLDEAQDVLSENYMNVLDNIQSQGLDEGRWAFFLDSNNQATVYGRMSEAITARLHGVSRNTYLTVNCRNTIQIAMHTYVLSSPPRRATARVDGPTVEYFTFSTPQQQANAVRRAIAHAGAQGISPSSLTLLYQREPNGAQREVLEELGIEELTPQMAVRLGSSECSNTLWSFVRSFKGMENDAIILADVVDMSSSTAKSLLYVAASRARTLLYVILDRSLIPERDARLRVEHQEHFGFPGEPYEDS